MKRLLVDYAYPERGYLIARRANESFPDDDRLVSTYPALFIGIDSEPGDKAAAIAALDAEVVSRDAAAAIAANDAALTASIPDQKKRISEAFDRGDRSIYNGMRKELREVLRVVHSSVVDDDLRTARERAWTAADLLANP